MSLIRFGYQNKTRGVAIQAVNNARSPGVAAHGKRSRGLLGVEDQSVGHRAGPVAARRMHQQIGLFVDGDEVIIFIQNFQRYILRQHFPLDRRRDLQFHLIATAQNGAHFSGSTVDQNRAGLDQFLQHGA